MKNAGKILLLGIALALWTSSAQAQTIRIVNNNASAPTGANVFSNIQDAVNAAVDGDIIHIIGSPNSYSGANVNKSLTIRGIGFMPVKDQPFESRLTSNHELFLTSGVSSNASGTVIEGVRMDGWLRIDTGISNITVRKCFFSSGRYVYEVAGAKNNILIEDNIFDTNNSRVVTLNHAATTGVVIRNNLIFYGYIEADNALIANNTFITNTLLSSNAAGIRNSNNCLIANNAFFKVRPRDNTVTNSIYNNNIALGSNFDTLPTPTAPLDSNAGVANLTGQGNKNNDILNPTVIDPATFFANVPVAGRNDWNAADDYNLGAPNPGNDMGTDGTDMGAYGGEDPFNILPNYPIIQTLNPTSPIKQGENLPTTISAQSN